MASIEDVARATGVSTATVSRALRGLSSVAEPTRARVQTAAQELGYVPSAAAASLATGRTKAIGLVTSHVARWYFAVSIETVESVLRTHGYDILLIILPPGQRTNPGPLTGVPPMRPRLERELLGKRVDATIILSLPLARSELGLLHEQGDTVVCMGPAMPGVRTVGIDDEAVGRCATRHLLDLGHRRLRFVGGGNADGEMDWEPQRERYRGFLAELRSAGIPEGGPVLRGDLTVEEGRRMARELLRSGTQRLLSSGVVCCSDEVAIGLMHELRAAGLDVPGQVSVVGVDDHPHAELHALTTIGQPVAEQAEIAARWLLGSLGALPPDDQVPHVPAGHLELLPTQLIVRGTTAACRGAVPAP